MIIKRDIYSKIENFLSAKEAVVVTGMRRVGKTTLLRYFYEKINSSNKLFIDLEDPLNRSIFEPENYEEIKNLLSFRGFNFSQKGYLFLDEVQFVKKIPSVVKYFYDHYQIKFFLSGSASFYLKNLFSESLAGRKYIFELYPLTFREFLRFKNIKLTLPNFQEKISLNLYQYLKPFFEEYFLWGGMPEIVLKNNPQEKELALRDIFSSYFQKEIISFGDFRKNTQVRNLILLLSTRVGQKLDIKKISSELGISRVTLYQYLDFLSGTYFISLIPAKGNIDIALRKQRKVYFNDHGILSILEKPTKGQCFENLVYGHLRQLGEVYYFQKGKKEIDFIIKKRNKELSAFEVKETADKNDIKRLNKISRELKIKENWVISLNFKNIDGVKYIFQI